MGIKTGLSRTLYVSYVNSYVVYVVQEMFKPIEHIEANIGHIGFAICE
jgi:hypothetical protein